MDKLKYVKLELNDGTYSDAIPLAVDSDYVDIINENLTNYIEQNDININNKVNTFDIVDNLNSNENNKVLSAKQGKVLNNNIKNFNEVKYIFPKSHTNTGDYNIIEVDDKIILIDCFINDDWLEFKGVLDSYEISHIDIFICTHFHRDHIGNFKNLVNNGYIDSETTIYFPTYNVSLWSSDSSYTGEHGYLEAMDVVEQNGFEPIHPTEGMEVVLNEHTKFIFYNTDDEYAYETFTQQNKYNNTSLIVLFKHYDINNIYWGDCYNQPVT